MPDQDDFEPLARQWHPAFVDYQSEATSEEVAEEALRVAAAMLRFCGGCPILPQLSDLLWQYQLKAADDSLWNPLSQEAFVHLNDALNSLARDVSDQRICTVAIRSAKIVSLQLQEKDVAPDRPFALSKYLATQVIKDLISHCFLDAARAYSVGGRFQTGTDAHLFYEEVTSSIDSVVGKMASQLTRRPTGKRLRQAHVLTAKHTTRSMLHDKAFRLDFDL